VEVETSSIINKVSLMKRGTNPKSKSNLISWSKGQSGNAKGRPRKIPELEELLANVLGYESHGTTAAEKILKALCVKAYRGDVRAAELLFDRGYGKAIQQLHVSTKEEAFIAQIEIIKTVRNDDKPTEQTTASDQIAGGQES
jgi:hypothetical protein